MKMLLKKIYTSILFRLFWLLPLQDKVLFSSFSGKKYGDNPKFISLKLREKDPKIKQVWLYKYEKFPDLDANILQVKWGSIAMIYHLATSKIWVDSHTKPLWVKKRPGQFYLETWHGGLGMKKIEGDAIDKLDKDVVKRIKHNSALVDLLISNCRWLTKIYQRAFFYDGEILECGYPKNDILFQKECHEDIRQKVLKYYQLKTNTKIFFYAPTFREKTENLNYHLDLDELIKFLRKEYGKEWVLFYRLHPLLMKEENIFKYQNKNIYDVTMYPDMQELIIASDMMMTDYSSGIFDFAMLYKPAFIYAYDLKEYEKERGLYFNLYDMPFLVAEDFEQLLQNIKDFDEQKYQKKLDSYFSKMQMFEKGNASEVIVKCLIHNLKNDKS